MHDRELLGIGAFGLLTGLTVTALRHYDEIGLLRPAAVDPSSRYRYYRRSQVAEEHHDDGPPHLDATFGEWGTPSWFLLSLWPKEGGRADVGFLVADVDEAHRQALAHGGTDVHGPRETPGMPRHAQVRDPAGNHVGLYQA